MWIICLTPLGATHAHSPSNRHDDITYQSIAKAFNIPIKLYPEAYERMKRLSKPRPGEGPFNWDVDSPARKAKLRMVELPTDDAIPAEKQFLFPREDLWVPVAVVNGNVHVLPGVPRLCKSLLLYLFTPHVKRKIVPQKDTRTHEMSSC